MIQRIAGRCRMLIRRTLELPRSGARRSPRSIIHVNNFLYLGRQYLFPVALEGALKLKEISYIHAEGYPAAEMKHGPIALVDENTPSVFLVPRGGVFDKVMSNLEEIKARGGPVIAVASEGDDDVAAAGPTTSSTCRTCRIICNRWWRRCRCNCWPTTSRCCAAATWTSRGIWRRA